MRVIAGSAKGMRLIAPRGLDVRPTLDRVREALFSILMPRLSGARFLDLFAGTGAIGIEALSRGASACTFVDSDPRSLDAVRTNLGHTRLEALASVCLLRLPDDLPRLARHEPPYDIVFADPPYDFEGYSTLLEVLARFSLVARDGIVVVEHAGHASISDSAARFARTRTSGYGQAALSFFA